MTRFPGRPDPDGLLQALEAGRGYLHTSKPGQELGICRTQEIVHFPADLLGVQVFRLCEKLTPSLFPGDVPIKHSHENKMAHRDSLTGLQFHSSDLRS